jgi:hypothetical protein
MKFKLYKIISICLLITIISVGLSTWGQVSMRGYGNGTIHSSDQNSIEFELVGQLSGMVNTVAVNDQYAYISGDDARLRVIDVSEPGSPIEVGSCELPGGALDIAVQGNHAYVTVGNSGLSIIDISSPTSPINVGTYDTPGSAQRVAVHGSFAYVADGNSGLRIIDVSDPSLPTEAGFFENSKDADDVAVNGKYAYLSIRSLRVIDILSPDSTLEVGRAPLSEDRWDRGPELMESLAISGNYTYVSGWQCHWSWWWYFCDSAFRVIDISSPNSPVQISYITLPHYSNIYDLSVSGNQVYLADSGSGLRVIDVRNPEAPVELALYDSLGGTVGVELSDEYVYLANKDGGLNILRVTLPEHLSVYAPFSKSKVPPADKKNLGEKSLSY